MTLELLYHDIKHQFVCITWKPHIKADSFYFCPKPCFCLILFNSYRLPETCYPPDCQLCFRLSCASLWHDLSKHRQKGSVHMSIHVSMRNSRDSLGKYKAICIKAEIWKSVCRWLLGYTAMHCGMIMMNQWPNFIRMSSFLLQEILLIRAYSITTHCNISKGSFRFLNLGRIYFKWEADVH